MIQARTPASIDVSSGWFEQLACPRCDVPLRQHSDNTLSCPKCLHHWPVIDGTPHFVDSFPYWGEVPLEQMREVNRLAPSKGWKAALLHSPDPEVQRASKMILNLDRANWQWLLNLPAESRVLDIGAGTGTNSHALALHYREVIAVEPVLERIEFMQHRFRQEGLSNVQTVRASLWSLPFAAESMDLAAMNGVLEWVAEGVEGDPADLQERALRKVARVLRPGGYLYLGIENRINPTYFIGYPDPHCRLPYVTVLPRPVAQWYARRKGAEGYRNYLYSSRGYRKLLEKAGFTEIEIYAAVPSYNDPRFLVPLKGSAYSHYARCFEGVPANAPVRTRLRGVAQQALLRMNLLKYLAYSFVILARRQGTPDGTDGRQGRASW